MGKGNNRKCSLITIIHSFEGNNNIGDSTAAANPLDNHLILLGHSDEVGSANGRMARRTVFNGDIEQNATSSRSTNVDMVNGNNSHNNHNHITSSSSPSMMASPKALQFLLRDDLFGHFMQ